MNKIPIDNIMKVVDVHYKNLKEETVIYLQASVQPAYIDDKLKEHLYSLDDIEEKLQEEDETNPYIKGIRKEIEALHEVMDEHEAPYLRIIF